MKARIENILIRIHLHEKFIDRAVAHTEIYVASIVKSQNGL
jgi:hypothetical protein